MSTSKKVPTCRRCDGGRMVPGATHGEWIGWRCLDCGKEVYPSFVRAQCFIVDRDDPTALIRSDIEPEAVVALFAHLRYAVWCLLNPDFPPSRGEISDMQVALHVAKHGAAGKGGAR